MIDPNQVTKYDRTQAELEVPPWNMRIDEAVRKVRAVIGDPRDQCYAASEAVWHLTGKVLQPRVMPPPVTGGRNHWFLRYRQRYRQWGSSRTGIVDPTVHQFTEVPAYYTGKGCGFLTKKPSKKAQKIIDAVEALKGGAA
jgi:hypothetical protein